MRFACREFQALVARSAAASRLTHRSQRMPLTWKVSSWTATSAARYRRSAPGVACRELAGTLARRRVELRRLDRQRADELGHREQAPAVDQLCLGPEPAGRPAVLLVDAAVGRLGGGVRERPLREVAKELDERRADLERGRLVRHPDLERAEARVRPNVPPELRVVGGDAGSDEASDPPLPPGVGAEDRRRAAAWQLREDLGAVRRETGQATAQIRRVSRQRQHQRHPGQDRLERPQAVLGARHAEVDMDPVHALAARRYPRVADELAVALLVDDLELLRLCEGMRAGSGQPHARAPRVPRPRSPVERRVPRPHPRPSRRRRC